MIVTDTSALISLATTDVFGTFLDEFEIHTTETVVQELEETATYDDQHGAAASAVLDSVDDDHISVYAPANASIESTRIDPGEASCLAIERELHPDFLLTDDLRALPELQTLSEAQVAISPIVLRALVKRGCLTNEAAQAQLDLLSRTRGWLGTPIFHRAQQLFED